MIQFVENNWHILLWSAGILAGGIAASLVARLILLWLLRRITRRRGKIVGESLVRHGVGPTRWIFPLLAMLCILPGLELPQVLKSALEHITGLGLIAATAWLVILFVDVAKDVIAGRYRVDVSDNLTARRLQTQFDMLHRIAVMLVAVVTAAIMLMTFPAIKHIGVSILASAGLASLVVGMAMKGTLSNLVAGVQIAFAQPFRIEDAVVIDNEWGWIEEIGMMYVVVRIWDLRRLVIPLSYFLDNAFQNWTRNSADLLGNTILYVDYTVPLEEMRAELKRICAASEKWRGKVCVLQVTDASEHTMQVRALMDANNSGDAFDLRCQVREGLIVWLQKNYPGSLPRYRGEMETMLRQSGPEGDARDLPPEPRRSVPQESAATDHKNHDQQHAVRGTPDVRR
ncbi:MAG TPA: mechanosensitive ion channel family protein [Acidobacteriaceae bacterium]|jgi:small-conductance mechanosensitive channel|nr:mechanosensitive ion channel family protein [Acidobacteriaceae bacterium]